MTGINEDLAEYVSEWTKKTESILLEKIQQLNIVDSKNLLNSVKGQLDNKVPGIIEAALSFVKYGRFVDMGVGKGVPIGGRNQRTDFFNSRNAKGQLHVYNRKPRKWYSRTFYARLHSLNNVISSKVQEEAINIIKSTVK